MAKIIRFSEKPSRRSLDGCCSVKMPAGGLRCSGGLEVPRTCLLGQLEAPQGVAKRPKEAVLLGLLMGVAVALGATGMFLGGPRAPCRGRALASPHAQARPRQNGVEEGPGSQCAPTLVARL